MAKTKRTFEQDDLFERKRYADFLKKLILNSDSYHRDDDVQAYTIAIDSPWGTGKSVFLEMFENMLEKECSEQVCFVHYNAWKNDFWQNALEPFADAIFSSKWFEHALSENTGKEAAKKFFSMAKYLTLAYLKKQTEEKFDIELLNKASEEAAKSLGASLSEKPSMVSKKYSAYTESLKEMQNAMEDVVHKTLEGGKLVIIIDELDRCRPTFAIETLEIVKHIMDVKDVVYIFALDVRQLGAAIKQVYGVDTDATGYLMRFFSYYSRMPVMKSEKIIKKIVKSEFLKVLDGASTSKSKRKYFNSFIDSMVEISNALHLSARDLETVGRVYVLMGNLFLAAYRNNLAYLLYWFLLCAKYKNPILFDEWIEDHKNRTQYPVSEQSMREIPEQIAAAIKKMNDPLSIGNLNFLIREDSFFDTKRTAERKLIEVELKNGKFQIIGAPNASEYVRIEYTVGQNGDLSRVLFYQDLLKWNKITGFTLKEYFASQLEMFNFIPEIPTAIE